ncbi:MAG: DUF4350 domain-containing protein [Pseudomonadota bacterium]
MSTRAATRTSPISGMLVGILAAVGVASFVAIFALLGWSPELAQKNRAGQHPYSTSALGYGGLVKVLKADGHAVTVSRLASSLDYSDGLLVLTLPEFGFSRADELDAYWVSEPALFVLPKWSGYTDISKPSWQKDTELLTQAQVEGLLATFDQDASIWRLRNPGALETPFGLEAPDFDHVMQVIESDSLETVIGGPGGDLMVKLPGREIYILADPDVVNTFGLAERANARFALNMMRWIVPWDGAPITIDATLHGFERSENLLRAIFDIPFIGATLMALATAGLIGWAAFIRFGPPERETRVLAFGKKALADNSAGLIAMARREGHMAPGYLRLTRRRLVRELGLPKTISDEELQRTLDAMAKQQGLDGRWHALSTPLERRAESREEIRDKASALWQWRKEMTRAN